MKTEKIKKLLGEDVTVVLKEKANNSFIVQVKDVKGDEIVFRNIGLRPEDPEDGQLLYFLSSDIEELIPLK